MNWLLVFYIIGCIISLYVNLHVFNEDFYLKHERRIIKIIVILTLTLLSWIYIMAGLIFEFYYRISRQKFKN